MIKPLLKTILRRVHLAGQPAPALVCPERIYGLETLSGLHPTAILAVKPEAERSESRICLGAGVYVGKDVEIAAYGPGSVIVGEGTTFQDRCQIYGDVEIGCHRIFARNVLVISTEHKIDYRPSWLIRDQDEHFHRDMAGKSVLAGRKIHIEEDCWLGWGSVVMPGVYIGRGAVIGANSVVTRDVAPYEIHGGAPNHKLGARLSFSPPTRLVAADENCLPYFYRGFRQKRDDLTRNLGAGIIEAGPHIAMVLAGGAERIRLTGINTSGTSTTLTPSINGAETTAMMVGPGKFDLEFPVVHRDVSDHAPEVLKRFTFLEVCAASVNRCAYGLSSAELVN